MKLSSTVGVSRLDGRVGKALRREEGASASGGDALGGASVALVRVVDDLAERIDAVRVLVASRSASSALYRSRARTPSSGRSNARGDRRRACRRRAAGRGGSARRDRSASASSMYGVETTIVRPPCFSSPSRSQNSRRDTASTPVVGSSRNRMSGRWTSAQQSASFCFMPPDSAAARRSLNGSSCV